MIVDGAALEAPAVVSGLDDVAVVGQAIEQCRCHLVVGEDVRPGASTGCFPSPSGRPPEDRSAILVGVLAEDDAAAPTSQQPCQARLAVTQRQGGEVLAVELPTPFESSPADFGAFTVAETEKWGKV
jgi:hypothetical protein